MKTYIFYADYEVLISNSFTALSNGGMFDVRITNQVPFTCELKNHKDVGLFGVCRVRTLGGGKVAIDFDPKTQDNPTINFMQKALTESPDKETRERAINRQNESNQKRTDYLRLAVQSFFAYMREFGIALREVDAVGTESKSPKGKAKQGRNNLTRDEVKKRKEIVESAKAKKKENPLMYWKEIAKDLDIPEKTLRDYRHKY